MDQTARFALRFSLLSALGLGLLYVAPMEPVLELLAGVVAWGLRASGWPVVVDGHVVVLPGRFGIDITTACSGAPHLVLFLGAVAAYPAPLRSRLIGAGLAAVAVLAGNLLRLLSLFWVGLRAPAYFELTHTYLWGGLSFAALCALWLVWLRKWGRATPGAPASVTPQARLDAPG